jgi:hypothetical protein
MAVLRENREALTAVLEPFLRDPTVAWGRSGRAQRAIDTTSAAVGTTGAGNSGHGIQVRAAAGGVRIKLVHTPVYIR